MKKVASDRPTCVLTSPEAAGGPSATTFFICDSPHGKSVVDDSDETILAFAYESAYHRGRLAEPTCVRLERNPACGDWVRLELRLAEAESVAAAYFDGGGCVVSQGAASLLCRYVEGRSLIELAVFSAADMLALTGIPLVPGRQRCALLGFRALKAIVYTRHPNLLPPFPLQGRLP